MMFSGIPEFMKEIAVLTNTAGSETMTYTLTDLDPGLVTQVLVFLVEC
jgi:hypothetical protein